MFEEKFMAGMSDRSYQPKNPPEVGKGKFNVRNVRSEKTKTMSEQHQMLNAEQVAILRRAITPASSEERPLLCEAPETTNQEERLKGLLESLTERVEEFEECAELIERRIFFEGTTKERLELERRYLLMQHLLFGSDDYCEPGVLDKEFEELRSSVKDAFGDCDEAKELLGRLDAVAEDMSDE